MPRVIRKKKKKFFSKSNIQLLLLLIALPVTLVAIHNKTNIFQFADEKTYIQIQPSSTAIRAGQSVVYDIVIVSEKQLVDAVSLSLQYPEEKIQNLEIDTSNSAFSVGEETTNSQGIITFSGHASKPVLGNEIIASITMEATDLFDSQEVIPLNEATITIFDENQNKTTINGAINTVYGSDAKTVSRGSVFQNLINSLLRGIQKVLPI